MASLAIANRAGAFTFAINCSSASISSPRSNKRKKFNSLRIRAETMVTERLGIKIEKSLSETKLAELGVHKWLRWACPPSKFPWTYTANEKCYFLEGKVKVYPEGHGDEYVEIEGGDFVEFPLGMKCTWDVSESVDKYYKQE